MLTQEQVLEAIKNGRSSQCLDGRDYSRLCNFFSSENWEILGFKLIDNADTSTFCPCPWTPDAIIEQLKQDVAFGFEKALDQRGLSAGFMYNVVKMWMWILEDELQDHDSYAMYGLPLFKAVAIKYGFPNEIGEDAGDESKYDCDY